MLQWKPLENNNDNISRWAFDNILTEYGSTALSRLGIIVYLNAVNLRPNSLQNESDM